jgi:hypothetical protein
MAQQQLTRNLTDTVYHAKSTEGFEYTLIFTGESYTYLFAYDCYDRDYISFRYYPHPNNWRTGKLQEIKDNEDEFIIDITLFDHKPIITNKNTNNIEGFCEPFEKGTTFEITTTPFKTIITFTGYQKRTANQHMAEAYEAYDKNDTQYWYYPYHSYFRGELEVPEQRRTYIATLSDEYYDDNNNKLTLDDLQEDNSVTKDVPYMPLIDLDQQKEKEQIICPYDDIIEMSNKTYIATNKRKINNTFRIFFTGHKFIPTVGYILTGHMNYTYDKCSYYPRCSDYLMEGKIINEENGKTYNVSLRPNYRGYSQTILSDNDTDSTYYPNEDDDY